MRDFLKTIQTQSSKRGLWLLLAAIALALDGGALFLQHVLQVEPCNECIYVRTGVLGIAVAGLLGALAPKYLVMRLIGVAAWVGALGWSLYRVTLLLDLERIVSEGGEASCKRFKGFPDWMSAGQLVAAGVRAPRHVRHGELDLSGSIGHVLEWRGFVGHGLGSNFSGDVTTDES